MLAGIVLSWYSASILGKYFTFDVAIQSGQNVIEVTISVHLTFVVTLARFSPCLGSVWCWEIGLG